MNISLNNSARSIRFSKDSVIFKEGDPIDTFYIINSGVVRCLKWSGDRLSPILTGVEGDIIGEDCVLSQEDEYFYSAVALQDCELVVVDKKDVDSFFLEQSPWFKSLFDNISDKVQNTIGLITEHRIKDESLLRGYDFSSEEEVLWKSKLK